MGRGRSCGCCWPLQQGFAALSCRQIAEIRTGWMWIIKRVSDWADFWVQGAKSNCSWLSGVHSGAAQLSVFVNDLADGCSALWVHVCGKCQSLGQVNVPEGRADIEGDLGRLSPASWSSSEGNAKFCPWAAVSPCSVGAVVQVGTWAPGRQRGHKGAVCHAAETWLCAGLCEHVLGPDPQGLPQNSAGQRAEHCDPARGLAQRPLEVLPASIILRSVIL